MRQLAVAFALAALTASPFASAADLLINFPASTPISKVSTSRGVLCKSAVSGYEFDSTMLGAGNVNSTCTAANMFPSSAPGYLAAGKSGTSLAAGAWVDIVPPVGVSFDLQSVRINTYGKTNALTLYGTSSTGASVTYALNTIPGVADYTIPSSAGLVNLSAATIQGSNDRIDITHVQIHDSSTPMPVSYSDTWTGNGYGGTDLINNGSTTAGKATLQLLPQPARFNGTVTGGSIVYVLPSGESLSIQNPTWTFKPKYPRTINKTSTATLSASGTGTDAQGYPVTVSIREDLRIYWQGLAWHYGVISGKVEVQY